MRTRTRDLIRGSAALATLLVLVVGVPAALTATVGWPLPTTPPSWQEAVRALSTGHIDEWTLVKALAVLVWVAWAQMTASVAVEAVATVRGQRTRRVPGPHVARLAAVKLVAAITLLTASVQRPAQASPPHPPAGTLASVIDRSPTSGPLPQPTGPGLGQPAPTTPPTATTGPSASVDDRSGPTWQVGPRDTLWGIAERTLGDGLRWRQIQALNVGRVQPDGDALQPDDDRIRPGWTLVLPADATISQPTPSAGDASATADPERRFVTVDPGDTLWDLAGGELGDPHLWPSLFEANKDRQQPDGRRLVDPDLIHPGWQLRLPDVHDMSPPGPSQPAPDTRRLHADRSPATDVPPGDRTTEGRGRDTSGPAPTSPARPGSHHDLHNRQPTSRDGPGPAQGHSDGQDEPEAADRGSARDIVRVAAAGMLAAGTVTTLDRIRRARRRRRRPGQHVALPEGPPAEAERHVRDLADKDAAELVDRTLDALAVDLADAGRRLPGIVLVSVGVDDLAVHLDEPEPSSPPSGWRTTDDGMTWVTTLATARQLDDDPSAAGTAPVLPVTIGTTADGHRRVMVNLTHVTRLAVEADRETRRHLLTGVAIELATTPRAAALDVVLAGFGERLGSLERVRVTEGAAGAVELIGRLADTDRPDRQPDEWPQIPAVVGLFPDAPPDEAAATVHTLTDTNRSDTSVLLADDRKAPARLVFSDAHWKLLPWDVDVRPVELDTEQLEQVGHLVDQAKAGDYVPTALASPRPDSDTQHTEATGDGRDADAAVIDLTGDMPPTDTPYVRILGPVQIDGSEEDFPTGKSEEMVAFLAMHRHPVDSDTLMEALWPNETPNRRRLHTEAWRARKVLGDDPDGEPYLPKARNDRYRLSEQVRVDYDDFCRLLEHAERSPDQQSDLLDLALDLVRGRPFSNPGRGRYGWAARHIHAIEQEIGDAAHQLAVLHLERGNPDAVAQAAQRGLAADEYFEALYRDLMRAAAANGNLPLIDKVMDRLIELINGDDGNDADDRLHPDTLALYDELVRHTDKESA